MTQPTPRQRIEEMWDRSFPVGPLLDAYRTHITIDLGRDLLRDGLQPFLTRLVGEANTRTLLAEHRAASLDEAADTVWALANRTSEAGLGALGVADMLRRMAEEARS